jgi:hypothetical protein
LILLDLVEWNSVWDVKRGHAVERGTRL